MNNPAGPSKTPAELPAGEVLHAERHSHLTTADIAKAVARHKREHPEHLPRKAVPQKPPLH